MSVCQKEDIISHMHVFIWQPPRKVIQAWLSLMHLMQFRMKTRMIFLIIYGMQTGTRMDWDMVPDICILMLIGIIGLHSNTCLLLYKERCSISLPIRGAKRRLDRE